jgi:tRNA (guanine37-N1)-methyltransferase
MERPCVKVPRAEGEATRRELAEADLLDRAFEISAADGSLYIPVAESEVEDLADRYQVVTRDVPAREQQQSPADLLGFEPSLERLGEVIILDEDDPDLAREIGQAVLASDLPARTVLNRASKVQGEFRVRDWAVVAGEDSTVTTHREYGHEYRLDVAEVYFSPRLATERHRVVEQASPDERAFDMFAGVGPSAVPMAARGADVVAVDKNPAAVEYLRENVARNGVADRVTVHEGDVRAVIASADRGPDAPPGYADWADRIVMNLPHSADAFLDAAVSLAGSDCVVHYYDIQTDEDPFGPGERAIRGAAEPQGYDVTVETRREVRSYAPHELNVCLDVRLHA